MTPPPSINEEYSDDESIYTLDSTVCDSLDNDIEYESNTSSDYCESENEAYELYLQKILFEEEAKRELFLEVFGNEFEDSDYESDNETIKDEYLRPTNLYFHN